MPPRNSSDSIYKVHTIDRTEILRQAARTKDLPTFLQLLEGISSSGYIFKNREPSETASPETGYPASEGVRFVRELQNAINTDPTYTRAALDEALGNLPDDLPFSKDVKDIFTTCHSEIQVLREIKTPLVDMVRSLTRLQEYN